MVANNPRAFNPTPDLADAVIDDLGDSAMTLRDIARTHGTTIEALTRWMQHDDIRARLDAIEAAVARRARLVATNYLPSLVLTLITQIEAHQYEETHTPHRPNDLKTADTRRRAREAARKAAALLTRIARFTPQSSHPRDKTPKPEADGKPTPADAHSSNPRHQPALGAPSPFRSQSAPVISAPSAETPTTTHISAKNSRSHRHAEQNSAPEERIDKQPDPHDSDWGHRRSGQPMPGT